MKRVLPYVLAAVLGAAAGYFLAPRSDSSVAQLETCQSSLAIEQGANDRLARQLNDAERTFNAKCDERIDASLAERRKP